MYSQDPSLHDTTVDQDVEAIVVHETVKPTEIDAEQTAVMKDIEQEHYHTTVQTISDTQVLPEQRTYNVKAVAEQVFEHGDGKPIDTGPQFTDERIINETRHDHTVLPTVVGEHIHHHIHERIQPIIQRGKYTLIGVESCFLLIFIQKLCNPQSSTRLCRSTRSIMIPSDTTPLRPCQPSRWQSIRGKVVRWGATSLFMETSVVETRALPTRPITSRIGEIVESALHGHGGPVRVLSGLTD